MREEKKKALLVGVKVGRDPDFAHSFAELSGLAKACGYAVAATETQQVDQINTGVYVGKGKADEIKALSHMLDVDLVIFDNSLSPMQLRNLNQIIDRPVMDRTNLILEIFSERARTREAKIQVECARLSYELPRLTGLGEMLSRQGGGTGGGLANKGAGEKKLELDRRKIRHRISELKKELRAVERQRATQRKRRVHQGIPLVALVGYTNAGKSTLMNALIGRFGEEDETPEIRDKKKVLVQDMLFATLDTTVRKITLPDRKTFLLSDTVGFVRHLPANLIESFHATLEEVRYADLLLEVVDYSDPFYREHRKVTAETLKTIGADHIPRICVYNKCDLALPEDRDPEISFIPHVAGDAVYLRADRGIGLDELNDRIREKLYPDYVDCVMLIPYSEGNLVAYFNDKASIRETEYTESGTKLSMSCSLRDLQKYKKYLV